jgi:hypothetical protein
MIIQNKIPKTRINRNNKVKLNIIINGRETFEDGEEYEIYEVFVRMRRVP